MGRFFSKWCSNRRGGGLALEAALKGSLESAATWARALTFD